MLRFVLVLVLALSGIIYVNYRLYIALPLAQWVKILAIVLQTVIILSYTLVLLVHTHLPVPFVRVLYALGGSAIIIFIYLVMAWLLIDIVGWMIPSLRAYFTHSWVGLLGLGVALTGLFVYANQTYQHKERVTLSLSIDKPLPKSLKIVGVSDLHLSYTIGRGELAKWVDLINSEQPDLVLIAGDIIDFSTRPLWAEDMAQEFRRLKAPLGVYTIMGNHEYIDEELSSIRFLKEAGIILLRDSVALINDTFYVVGRDDKTNSRRKALNTLVSKLDKTKPILLLDHQPEHLEQAEEAGIDFQLSGHTHRGQVFPLNLITDRLFEVSHGYKQKGNTHIYVSSGLGIWGGKYRIGTQSEYLVLELQGRK